MNQLLADFSNLNISTLSNIVRHDIHHLIWCLHNELPGLMKERLMLNHENCQYFIDSKAFFAFLLQCDVLIAHTHELLELMPYIDDYLEHFDCLKMLF